MLVLIKAKALLALRRDRATPRPVRYDVTVRERPPDQVSPSSQGRVMGFGWGKASGGGELQFFC